LSELKNNRKVAVVITVIVMILATLFGSHRSLVAKAAPIEEYFVNGADGYSIQRDLDAREALAKNLQTVANRYLSANAEAMTELNDAINTMDRANTIQEKSNANQKLTAATEHVYLELEGYPLSAADNKYRTQIKTDLASYNQIISHDKYNEMVVEYNRDILGQFPASLLAKMTRVPELPTF